MNTEPQVTTSINQDTLTISASFTVQAVPFHPVTGLRTYTTNISPNDNKDEIERKLIEQAVAVAVASMVVDIQLTGNHKQKPRFRDTWEYYAYLCPTKFRSVMGITDEEVWLL